jgi:APA family basic amino acid/polyamine antiporter
MSIFSKQTLFRKKLPQADAQSKLKPVLGAFDLVLLGIGAIIGTGIFVLTGVAAATTSGPAVVLSFLVAGIACVFAALSYSELAASVGGCGSAYGYSYAAFGELFAWIIGWDLLLEYAVAVAAVANGWSGYFNNALEAMGYGLPEYLTRGPQGWSLYFHAPVAAIDSALGAIGLSLPSSFDAVLNTPATQMNWGVNLPSVVIILLLMLMLCWGVTQSARLNAGMVLVKLLAIAVFIGVAVFHIQPENWSPFMPFGWFDKVEGGKTIGILAGASLVFFAYVGFDAVSTAVEEARDPKRDIPIGIVGSLAFCTLIYIIVSGLLTGIVPYTELNVTSPVSFALHKVGVNWASALVAGGVIAGLTTVMLVLYYGLTRIILAMSRDGLLPASMSVVHEKRHTPVRVTVICGFIMAFIAGCVPYGILAELVNIGTLTAFVMVCIGVIVLRLKHPDMPRPFKMPFGITIPVLGVLSCGALIVFLPLDTQIRFVVWLAVGVAIYFLYSVKNSKLNNPK